MRLNNSIARFCYISEPLLIILIGFAVRIFIAFYPLPITEQADAIAFHNASVDFATSSNILDLRLGWIYTSFLGLIYKYISTSIFIGNSVSCLAWLISAFFFFYSVKLITSRKEIIILGLVIYCFLPSSILFTSVTLREAYQLLFLNASFYFFLKLYFSTERKYFFGFFVSIFLLGLLHGALLSWGLFVVLILVLSKLHRYFLIGFLILTLIFIYYFINPYLDHFIDVLREYKLNAIKDYARANYEDSVKLSQGFSFYHSGFISFVKYILEPYPNKITNIYDFVVFSENVLRIFLFIAAIFSFGETAKKEQPMLLLGILFYTAIEIIWSLGTVNWGTAIRHHVPSIGLLVFISTFYFKNSRLSFYKSY